MAPEVTGSEIAYDGVLSRVRLDRVRFADGGEATREVVEHIDAVAVVPLHDDGTVTLVRQYRHPLRAELLEIPAGVLDVDGEEGVDAARRELAEETGLAARELRQLTTFANSGGWTDETTAIYLAAGLEPTAAPQGYVAVAEEAAMRVERLALDAALAAVRNDVADAKTLIGLLLAAEAP